MLKIINRLEPFFKDNYRRISVREYSRMVKISPPTASKFLEDMYKEGLLKKEKDRIYNYYFANRKNKVFVDFSRIYWYEQFRKIGLIDHIENEITNPTAILFGSFSKAEISPNSDIDIAIFVSSKKRLNFNKFERKLNRKIQLFIFSSIKDIKNENLLNNILNGTIIKGGW